MRLLAAIFIGRPAIRQDGDYYNLKLGRELKSDLGPAASTSVQSPPPLLHRPTEQFRMVGTHRSATTCSGPLPRREFLRCGMAGLGSLALPDLLRQRALAEPSRRVGGDCTD